MKHRLSFRGISFIIALVFSLNLFTVMASANTTDYTDSFVDLMYNQTLSGSYEGTFSFKADEPFEFIDALAALENADSDDSEEAPTIYDITNPMNGRIFAESLVEFSGTFNADYNISENYDKIQMFGKFTLDKPITLNENFSFEVGMGFEMYMDVDFSDLNNPVYKLTVKTPMNEKYIYIDYSEMLKETLSKLPDSALTEEAVFSAIKAYMEKTVSKVKESLKKNATVTYSNMTYTMKIDDKGFKNIMFDMMDTVLNSTELMQAMAFDAQESQEELDYMKESFEDAKQVINKITILGENGYTVTYKVDNNHKPTEVTSTLDIGLNLYDIVYLSESPYLIDIFSQIDRSKCGINLVMEESYKLSNVGQDITINYPTLTPENSFDFVEIMKATEEYENNYDYDFSYTKYWFSATYDGYRVERDGENYIPVRAFADSCYISDENILVNDGIITLIPSDEYVILPFETLSFYENGNVLFVNGQEFWLEHPTFEADGTTYIPVSALKIININVSSLNTTHTYYPETGETYVSTSFSGSLTAPVYPEY